jgi:protein disulfide-isomerase A6
VENFFSTYLPKKCFCYPFLICFILGYPSIKIFYPDGRVEDYNGGRTASDFVQQGMILFEDVADPPELRQLTSQATIDEGCKDVQVKILLF